MVLIQIRNDILLALIWVQTVCKGYQQTIKSLYTRILEEYFTPQIEIGVLIDFSLTVKAATLIFISGRGSAISSAKQGKSGSIYNLVNLCAFHENPNRIHTELTFINS